MSTHALVPLLVGPCICLARAHKLAAANVQQTTMEESSSLPTSGWHAAVANARSTGARPVRDEAARASERSGFMSLSPSPQASNVWTVLSSTYVAVACTITGAHPSAMLLRIFQDVLSGHGSNDLAAIAQDVVIALLRQVPRSAVIWTFHQAGQRTTKAR